MADVYTLIEDPGHAWIGVPFSELVELGIADKITMYSYLDKAVVWLEEDLDFSTWISAKAMREGVEARELCKRMLDDGRIVSRHVEHTYIRDLPAFEYVEANR